MNTEGMTWNEWFAAACFGTKYSNCSHVEACLTMPEVTYKQLRVAWKDGQDPSEYSIYLSKMIEER